ncbi:hypothetical protein [Streptomyces virginiae]|uniref:hypothetical protein n=1 Tax=Streptomyces virginiae TaxID=1961 RepID=UPI0032540F06
MKRTTLRAAGISAIAAVAIGIAAPAASAATTAPVRTVAAVQSADVTTTGAPGLNIASQAPAPSPADVAAVQNAAENAKGKAFIELLKRTGGLFAKAVSKAKEGHSAFREWMGKQNIAVKAAWYLLAGGTQSWVIDYLMNL